MDKNRLILIGLLLLVTIIFIPIPKIEHKKNISTESITTNEQKIQIIYGMITNLEIDSYQKLQERGRLLLEAESLSGVISSNDRQVSVLFGKVHDIKYSGIAR